MTALITCLTWYFSVLGATLSSSKSLIISLIFITVFTFFYSGGLDYEAYSDIVMRLDFNHVNPERLSLYVYSFFFGNLTVDVMKILSLPIYFLSIDTYARRQLQFSKYQRMLMHLFMFMIPLGYIAALTVFRQTLAISFLLLMLSSKFWLSKTPLLMASAIHHLSFPVAYIAVKAERYYAVLWLIILLSFIILGQERILFRLIVVKIWKIRA